MVELVVLQARQAVIPNSQASLPLAVAEAVHISLGLQQVDPEAALALQRI